MCAVRISLLPVSSCSCSQEEIRSLGIAEPVSLKIISATVLALLGCSTEPRYSGFHAQCIRSRFRADDGRTRCTAAGIYQSFGNIRKARSEMAGFLLVGGNIGGKNRDKQLFHGEGGIRPPAGGPPRVARRPRRLAKCPRFESLHAVKTNIPHPLVRDVCFWKRYRVLIEKRLRGCTACLGGCISI